MRSRTCAPVVARLLALAAIVPSAVSGQELSGTLRFHDGRYASGTLVVAVSISTSVPVGRVLVGESGRFTLPLPEGTYAVRVLRIGHAPSNLGQFTLRAGERRFVNMSLADSPIILEPVSSRAAQQCNVPSQAGARVVALFEEARKALVMSQLAPSDGRPMARVAVRQVIAERDGREIDTLKSEVRSGPSSRPFQSPSPEVIAELGYVSDETDGIHYRGPDPTALLSPEFASSHCFSVTEDSGAAVGLRFEPVGRRDDFVDIAGTMWLDGETLELRRVDFAYEGLRSPHDRWNLGGYLEFARLPDGLWFESRWEIRMPLAARSLRSRVRRIIRGEVLTLHRGERIVYSAAGTRETP